MATRSFKRLVRSSAALILLSLPALAQAPLNIGQPAGAADIERFVLYPSIYPDGRGLPGGSGSARAGFEVYVFMCAGCHGGSGEGGPYDTLVETRALADDGVRPAIGNYWPYATTLFDYVNRAMPFDAPGSLSSDDVYAVVAWLLHENGLLAADAVLDAETLPTLTMPARTRFYSYEGPAAP